MVMFCLLQWNARSLMKNGQELKKFINELEKEPELICVQETWLKSYLDFVIPGYECLRLDRMEVRGRESEQVDRSHGGCETFIKNGMQYRRVDISNDLECLAVEVWDSHIYSRGVKGRNNDSGEGNSEGGNGYSSSGI